MHSERRPNPDRSTESLEIRLRALPQPPVRADLEARLLANIPAAMPIPRRSWAGVAGAVGGLAAAGLLAFFTLPGRDGKNRLSNAPTNKSAHQVESRPLVANDRIAAWRQYRRALDGEELPTFTWPLPENVAQIGIQLDSSRSSRSKERN